MPGEAFFWFTARTVIRCSDRWWKRLNLGTGIVAEKFKFRIGQLIDHQRYGYRGVVVSRDEQCRASKGWYESNLTRPARDQPWLLLKFWARAGPDLSGPKRAHGPLGPFNI